MDSLNRIVSVLLLAAAVVLLVAGCKTPDEPSSIPWNAPTDWERRGGIGLPIPEYN